MDCQKRAVLPILAVFLLLGMSSEVSAQSSTIQLIASPVYTRQGIVLVSINGSAYGAICDTNWNVNDSVVVCRQLGFDVSAASSATPQYNSAYGTFTFTGVMTQVSCLGNEIDITHCPYVSPITNPAQQCTNANFAGVSCFGQYIGNATASTSLVTCQNTANVRLLNGTSTNFTNGILQVSQNGATWGTVCTQGFTQTDAKVVCSSLCSGVSTNAISYPGSYYGQGAPLKVVLSNVSCVGTESSILQCPSNGFNTSTTCSDSVGINCASTYSYLPSGTLTCGGTNMQIVFNQISNYVISSVTPINPSLCVNASSYSFTTASSTYIFTLSYTDCNTSTIILYNSNGLPANYQYSNLILISVQDNLGIITRAGQFQMELTCQIQRTSTTTNTYQTGTITLYNNGTIPISAIMNFFADSGYSIVLQPPILLQLNTPVYAQVTVSQTAAALNYRVVVPTCVASPYLNITAPLYYLIENNCINDTTTVQFASPSAESMIFVFYSFRFMGNYSAVYLQCTTLLCAQNDYTGLCSGQCGTSSGAVGRRKRDISSQVKQTHMINGPLYHTTQALNYNPGAPAAAVPIEDSNGVISRSVGYLTGGSVNSSSVDSTVASGLATTSLSFATSTNSVFLNLTSTATSFGAAKNSTTILSIPSNASSSITSIPTTSLNASSRLTQFSSSASLNYTSRPIFNALTLNGIYFSGSSHVRATEVLLILPALIAVLIV